MPDETPIGIRTLMLKCDFDAMIGNPLSQAVKADS